MKCLTILKEELYMAGFLLFIHLSSLAVWVGSLVTVAILLLSMKKQFGSPDVRGIAKRTIRTFNRITHPSAFLVLVSGLGLFFNAKIEEKDVPFWLHYMREGGSVLILLAIIVLSIRGRKVINHLTAVGDTASVKNEDAVLTAPKSAASRYAASMLVAIVLILSIIFVVSYKFT
jgi:putative copper export protein